jgi:hypothetical protein
MVILSNTYKMAMCKRLKDSMSKSGKKCIQKMQKNARKKSAKTKGISCEDASGKQCVALSTAAPVDTATNSTKHPGR